MSFFGDFFGKMESAFGVMAKAMQEGCKFVEVAAPVVKTFAPLAGPDGAAIAAAAGAATVIATATDKAITDHQAAGATPQATTIALAQVAQSVAASGAVDATTAAKIQTIVNTIPPEIMAGMVGA